MLGQESTARVTRLLVKCILKKAGVGRNEMHTMISQ